MNFKGIFLNSSFIERKLSMTINVLGLGESLKYYKEDGNISIGVNDIHSRIKTDFVVCVDHPEVFSPERLETILKTECKGFYSQLFEWHLYMVENFQKIEFNRGRGILDGLDSDRFCYSNSSPYVATVLAYKLGAKEIILHGVDFKTHQHFKGNSKDRALNDFKNLSIELKKRGVFLYVGNKYSELAKFLPIYDRQNT